MSALSPEADMLIVGINVRSVPEADFRATSRDGHFCLLGGAP